MPDYFMLLKMFYKYIEHLKPQIARDCGYDEDGSVPAFLKEDDPSHPHMLDYPSSGPTMEEYVYPAITALEDHADRIKEENIEQWPASEEFVAFLVSSFLTEGAGNP